MVVDVDAAVDVNVAVAEPRGDLLLRNAGLLLTIPRTPRTRDPEAPDGPLGRVERGALLARGGRVVWTGPEARLPRGEVPAGAVELDAGGALVTPGLVDPHTHPLFAGSRAAEFAARARGASYLEIARQGGGIQSTVQATRAASDEALVELCRKRLWAMLSLGTTAAEAKTGYALAADGELRLLGLLGRAQAGVPMRLSRTLLAAHAIPAEAGDAAGRAAWVARCADELPALAARHGAASVDVYADAGAYTIEEARRILAGAKAAGLAARLHADQIARTGGAELAAELGCVSADHLENVSREGIAALAGSRTIAVCLPGAALTLGLPAPPARALLDAGARVALGTDLNPGSSYSESLPVQMWLACTQLRMTVEECWRAATVEAAAAALLPDCGRLEPGAWCDLVVWDAEHPAEIAQHYGAPLTRRVVVGGAIVSLARAPAT